MDFSKWVNISCFYFSLKLGDSHKGWSVKEIYGGPQARQTIRNTLSYNNYYNIAKFIELHLRNNWISDNRILHVSLSVLTSAQYSLLETLPMSVCTLDKLHVSMLSTTEPDKSDKSCVHNWVWWVPPWAQNSNYSLGLPERGAGLLYPLCQS